MKFKNLTALLCALAFMPGMLSAQVIPSENHTVLKNALKEYPGADANRDGILTREEAEVFKASRVLKKG